MLQFNKGGWFEHSSRLLPVIGTGVETRVLRLAPMSPLVLGLTLVAWAIPVALFTAALFGPADSPRMPLALLLIGTYTAVWLWWRPARFEISPTRLDVIFPGRRRSIPRDRVTGARLISKQDFRREFGRALRIGVGGLWGGFGWLWTQRGLVDFYVSRADGFVLIEQASSRPLILTPEEPERMVEALVS